MEWDRLIWGGGNEKSPPCYFPAVSLISWADFRAKIMGDTAIRLWDQFMMNKKVDDLLWTHIFSRCTPHSLKLNSQAFAFRKSATSHSRLKYKCYRYLLIMNNRPFIGCLHRQQYKCECVLMCVRAQAKAKMLKPLQWFDRPDRQTHRGKLGAKVNLT